MLEATLIPDFKKSLTEKAYLDYIKQNEYLKTYRIRHKEKKQLISVNYTRIMKSSDKRHGKNS